LVGIVDDLGDAIETVGAAFVTEMVAEASVWPPSLSATCTETA